MSLRKNKFPTARNSGDRFPLILKTDKGHISGETGREFLLNIMIFIDELGLLAKIAIPFKTSGENYLLSYEPKHSNGSVFTSLECFISVNTKIYINTNHPRFFVLRQGARILEAVGIKILK